MKGKCIALRVGFLALAAIAAFRHDGLVEAVPEIFRKLVNLVIAVNFDGLFGGIHDHVAFVAPMKVLVQFGLKALADPAVKVIGQLF
jgi:hypothetical protein